MKHCFVLWLTMSSVFLLLGGGCGEKSHSPTLSTYVSREIIEQRVSIPGRLRALRETQIFPAYSGTIRELLVNVGDFVLAGAPIVRISQTPTQSLNEVFPLRTPFDGVVSQVLRKEGEYVSTGSGLQPILMIHDLSEMWMSAQISEMDVTKIRVGQNVQVRVNATPQRTYGGVLKSVAISPRQAQDRWDRGRIEYNVEIQLEDVDESLRPGMSAVADVIAQRREGVLAIPPEYLHREGQRFYLKTVEGDRHFVETGLVAEQWVEIVSGAEEGLEVVMVSFGELGRR